MRENIGLRMKEQGISIKELARRLEIKPNTLTQRLRQGSFPIAFLTELAMALGLTVAELVSGRDGKREVLWNPAGQAAAKLFRALEPHEMRARTGVGFFRIPNCAVLGPPLMSTIHHNLFAGFGESGLRMAHAYDGIGNAYQREYLRTEGRYGGCELKTLFLASDLNRLIMGSDPYQGCGRFIPDFLDGLRREHIPRLNYRMAVIDDARVPDTILYGLAGLDSLVVIGESCSVRRVLGTYELIGADSGAALQRDVQMLRTLESLAGDLTPAKMRAAVERLLRAFEMQNRSGATYRSRTRLAT